MQLFQKSVLQKYINQLNHDDVSTSYEKFKEFFFNPQIQENIRLDKEEQFQEGFLRELFVNVFSYIINPHPDYNLTTEYKNETGAKKADGAVLKNGEAIGVIELKSTKTKDLESIRKQAFDYKANHKSCIYVVTSNFEKLRFYINNAVEYEEFDLFNITKDRFSLLYLCLNNDYLLNNIPLKIKEESLVQEEAVTKKLYSDYSEFKKELFQDIVDNNVNNLGLENEQEIEQKKLLFKKTQKLIDRILFILFCEDRGLLPPNEISKIISEWEKLKDLDAYTPLYERFRKHFGYINKGYKKDGYEIFAYNGGLFEEDEVLKDLKISDDVLRVHTKKLTSYDFESEVDVDILGHIFEQSITEIETVTAEIESVKFDKNKSRRKKEGVYYTPKYITKYIVDNTVGKLCEEKKNELGILEEEYFKGRKHRKKDTILELEQKLNDYQKYLLTLRICDPACGSGAFLNQALVFLINEHKYIAELKSKLFEQTLILPDIEHQILEKNLYGVDINEEAVEIAKLSLWLRTAKKGRRLTSLNENIKCGNSLIDDPEVVGDKAFKWEQEFPEVFSKDGFDIVIGNPPYVNFANLDVHDRKYYKKHFSVYKNKTDLYAFFIEVSTKIIKNDGKLSFIIPHTWVSTTSFHPLRKLILENYNVASIVELDFGVFQDSIVKTLIIVLEKGRNLNELPIYDNKFNLSVKIPLDIIYSDKELVINLDWNNSKQNITNKILNKSKELGSILKFTRGIKTSNDKRFIHTTQENNEYKKLIRGRNIKAYSIEHKGEYVWYRPDLMKEKKGCLPHTLDLFEVKEKLVTQRVNSSGQLLVAYDNQQYYCLDTTNVSTSNNDLECSLKYLLAILNSRLINWWFNDRFKMPTISGYELHQIPIKILNKTDEAAYNMLADKMIVKVAELHQLINHFLNFLKSKHSIDKFSLRLRRWYRLQFSEFLDELKKSKINLSLSEEVEWMEYFNEQKAKALQLKAEIDKTDKEIDHMVYELYGLNDGEIKIVEKSVNN